MCREECRRGWGHLLQKRMVLSSQLLVHPPFPQVLQYISRPPGRDLRDGAKAIRLLADGVLREKHWDIHSDSFRMGDRGNVLSHPPVFLSPARCPCPPQPGCEVSIVWIVKCKPLADNFHQTTQLARFESCIASLLFLWCQPSLLMPC